jgi:hypothetical protein
MIDIRNTIGWKLELRSIEMRINETSFDAATILAWLKTNLSNPAVQDALNVFNIDYNSIYKQFSLTYYAGFDSEVEKALKSDISDYWVYDSIKNISDVVSRILVLLRVHYDTYYSGYYEESKKYYKLLHNLDCLYLVVEASELISNNDYN